MTTDPMAQVNALYIQAIQACKRADRAGKRYIAIQEKGDGSLQFLALHSPDSRPSAYRFNGFTVIDWAQNVVYRANEAFWLDLPVDEFFSRIKGS